jgi:hypothetical protein
MGGACAPNERGRNIERFPDYFIFQSSDAEFADLKSQIVISSWGGLRCAARKD